MTPATAGALVAAGVGGGLSGSVAGLASLITYPALLAIGLPPVTANVTNTVALIFSSTGSVSGSLPELRGQWHRVRALAAMAVLGGAAGGALLLVTPASAFEALVPVLIGVAAIAILARRRLVEAEPDGTVRPPSRAVLVAVFAVAVYGGYFGAGAGVLLLAVLLHTTHDALPHANAIKNVVLGMANGIAAVGFALFGPVRWSMVVPLGAGLFVGARMGPAIVRRVPSGPLRVGIAIAGLGVAVKLGLSTY